MIVAFMLYSFVVGVLAAAAAWFGEKVLAGLCVARRAAWIAGLAVALTLPVIAVLLPVSDAVSGHSAPAFAASDQSKPMVAMSRIELFQLGDAPFAGRTLNDIAAVAWALLSTVMMAFYLVNAWQLSRCVRRWRATRILGFDVAIAPDIGPAAFGWRRPRVIFPAWLLSAPSKLQRLALAHEAQHIAAKDPQVLGAATILNALFPWNLALSWMWRRLRFAMEVDCDARVLRGGADAGDYGMALVFVSERQARVASATVALTEHTSQLERRIDIMLSTRRKWSVLAVGACLALAAACLVAAASLDAPRKGEKSDSVLKPPPGKGGPGWKLGQQFEILLREKYPDLLAGNFEGTPIVVALVNPDWSIARSAKTLSSQPLQAIKTSEEMFGVLGLEQEAVAYVGNMAMQVAPDSEKLILMVYTERKAAGEPFVSKLFPDTRALDRAIFARHFPAAERVPAGHKPWVLLDRSGKVLRSGLDSAEHERWDQAMEQRFPGIRTREVTVTAVTNEDGDPAFDAGGKELHLYSVWLTPESSQPAN